MPSYLHFKTSLVAISLILLTNSASGDVPLVEVLCNSPADPIIAGAAIPISVDIVNHLEQPIGHATYSLVPTADNDEARGLTVQAVYRDRMENGGIRVLATPAVAVRHATPVHMIGPGEKLTVHLDASKWQIADGWKPGQYKLSVRITHLHAGSNITMSVDSSICEFEISSGSATDWSQDLMPRPTASAEDPRSRFQMRTISAKGPG